MKRFRAAACAVRLIAVLLSVAAVLRAVDPAKKAVAEKPPWQRLLQGEDAKKATEQEKKLAQLQEAGQFAEALKVAEGLTELRDKVQGAEHWQAVSARSEVEAIRRALRGKKEEQQSYRRAFALRREADALAAKGRYREAQPLLEQVLSIKRKVLGEEHPNTARSYNSLALNLKTQAKYRDAEEGYGKALAIRRKVLGEEHPETAQSYNNEATNLHAQGKYKEAERGIRKALAIRRKVLGEEHPETAQSYNNLAVNLNAQSKYREAEIGYGKALAIRRKVLGEEHPETAQSYNNTAFNLNAQGKYREAEEGFRKALAIWYKVLGEKHPYTAASYNNLAFNLKAQSRYREAEEECRKALAIWRKMLGEEHPHTATSYNNLAIILDTQGKYKEAEEGHRKALAIRRKVLGEERPETAVSYNNVAVNLNSQGKYKAAEEGHRKALAIWRKLLGEEHPNTAASYNNIAVNLKAQGKYREAEEDNRKALAIRRKVLGEDHPDTAQSYDNLADNQHAQGKYREAEEDNGKALAIRRKVLGEEHPETARSYNNLANNQHAQGKYREAEERFRKALAIWRKLLGEEHPDTAQSYDNTAFNLNAQGKYREAEIFYLRAADSFAKARLHVAATGLERAVFSSERSPLSELAAVLARNGKPQDAWQRFEESLSRGAWDDLSARLRRTQEERVKQAQINAHIDRLQKLIEGVSTAKPPPEQLRRREELLSQLRQAYDELAAFTQLLEQKYGPVTGQVFDRGQIQASLPNDAALVAWLDMRGHPKAADPNGEHWAILLRSAGSPIWVRLPGSGDKGAWTDDDTKLPARFRAAVQSAGSDWQPIAQRLRKQRLDPLAQHLKGVRRLIVLPSIALAGVPVEVIAEECPTRSASRNAVAERLHHNYTVSYAHSGTMYAHLRQQRPPSGKGLFALADPVFDPPDEQAKPQPLPPGGLLLTLVQPGSNAARAGLRPNDVLLRYGDTDLSKPADLKLQAESNDPDKPVPVTVWRNGSKLPRPLLLRPGKLGVVIAREAAPQAVAEQRRIDRLLASRSGDDGKWDRLPGTRIEAASLQRLFGSQRSQLLLDSESSEQRLNDLAHRGELGNYRYIHLATHGHVDDAFPLRSAVILSRDRLPDDKRRTEMLLSGQAIPDGRLTAEEALQRWNLQCELVTLSACQTALGKYERGEGFVGFAQALILCGSRSVCLSLWRVDDAATALLMERFYQNLLGKRDGLKAPLTKADALREAKEWLRTLPREEALKRAASLSVGVDRGMRKKLPPLELPQADKNKLKNASKPNEYRPYAHPYYWAGFILTGDPG